MITNFWYACEFSHKVGFQPFKLKLLGFDLVLYRDSKNKVRAVFDRCPHRGDRFSRGTVKGDCITCPFHGWKFNSDGNCINIPSLKENEKIPKAAKLLKFDTAEKYGLIWVFFGDLEPEERPPLPDFPQLEDPSFASLEYEYFFRANYLRVLENGIDISHLPFLHQSTYGFEQNPIFEKIESSVVKTEYSGKMSYRHEAEAPGLLKIAFRKPLDSVTNLYYHMPNISITTLDMKMGTFILFMSHLPVSEFETRTIYLGLRNFYKPSIFNFGVKNGIRAIVSEDQTSVEEQRPRIIPEKIADEVHVDLDALPLSYRRMHKKYFDKGWNIENLKFFDFLKASK